MTISRCYWLRLLKMLFKILRRERVTPVVDALNHGNRIHHVRKMAFRPNGLMRAPAEGDQAHMWKSKRAPDACLAYARVSLLEPVSRHALLVRLILHN